MDQIATMTPCVKPSQHVLHTHPHVLAYFAGYISGSNTKHAKCAFEAQASPEIERER